MTNEAYHFADSAIIFCALNIEYFLNDYGLKRIDEQLYTDLLERKNPSQKYKLIWQICFDEIIKNDNKGFKAVKNLFRERNDIVHPKTKIFDFEDPIIQEHPEELEIQNT